MPEESVAERPHVAATLTEIEELMDYERFFEIGRRFPSANQLSRKHRTEQSAS